MRRNIRFNGRIHRPGKVFFYIAGFEELLTDACGAIWLA
jgi:hypothetical protein